MVVRNLMGDGDATFRPVAVPSVVFSDPPLAAVGLTAEEAAARGIDVGDALIDMSGWVSARRVGSRVSGARVLVERHTGRVVGAHLLAHDADEMINLFTAVIAGGLSLSEIKAIPWAYPTSTSEIGYLL